MLMGLMSTVLSQERPLKSFGKFFHNNTDDLEDIDPNSFGWGPLEVQKTYQILPVYSNVEMDVFAPSEDK